MLGWVGPADAALLGRRCLHYESMPIHIYRKNLTPKIENFQIKNANTFLISAQNMDCWYSLEPPRQGGSNEYHNLCF